jgi:hypothetical protein
MSTLPVPRTVLDARRALVAMKRAIDSEKTYEALRKLERAARAIRALFVEVEGVRREAEEAIILANHRIGGELLRGPKAKGTRSQLTGSDASGAIRRKAPENTPTLREQVGSQIRGIRLKQLAAHDRATVLAAVAAIHAAEKDATVSGERSHVSDAAG